VREHNHADPDSSIRNVRRASLFRRSPRNQKRPRYRRLIVNIISAVLLEAATHYDGHGHDRGSHLHEHQRKLVLGLLLVEIPTLSVPWAALLG